MLHQSSLKLLDEKEEHHKDRTCVKAQAMTEGGMVSVTKTGNVRKNDGMYFPDGK